MKVHDTREDHKLWRILPVAFVRFLPSFYPECKQTRFELSSTLVNDVWKSWQRLELNNHFYTIVRTPKERVVCSSISRAYFARLAKLSPPLKSLRYSIFLIAPRDLTRRKVFSSCLIKSRAKALGKSHGSCNRVPHVLANPLTYHRRAKLPLTNTHVVAKE